MSANAESRPPGWAVAKLDEMVTAPIVYGILQPGPDVPDGVPYVRPTEIDTDLIQVADLRRTSERIAQKYRRSSLQPADIILSIVGTIGKVALVPTSLKGGNITQSSARVRVARDALLPEFTAYALRSPFLRRQYDAARLGTAVPRLNLAHVRDLKLPVAPLSEQRRIVDAIDSYLTRLDEVVVTLERVQAKLKAYRSSVLKAAVEGRLVPTEASLAHAQKRDYEPASVLLSHTVAPPRPNRWSSRSKDVVLGHSALAVGNPRSALPEGWTWSPLVNIARMETGHTPSREHPEWWDGDVPWIGIVDARAHHGRTILDTIQHTNNAGLDNSAARLLPAGTVCISRTASVGYVLVTGRAMATSQDFVNWTPTGAVLSEWLRVVFTADREALGRFGKGSVHKTIYFPEWLSVHVAVPPLAEQARIVAQVDSLMSVTNALEVTVATQLRRCRRLRQSILKWAFEGKLVDQDPRDEPAKELLTRIRSERIALNSTKKTTGRRARGAA